MIVGFLAPELFQGESTLAKLIFRKRDLIIEAVNNSAVRLYGLPSGQLMGKPILELSATPRLTMEAINNLRTDRPSASVRHIHKRADGSSVYVNVGYDCCEWEGETWICKYVQDATEAERIERQLRDSHERFMAVADYTYDWESWINEKGEVVWVNLAVEQHTGYTVQECLQMPHYPLPMIAPEDCDTINRILFDALNGVSGNDIEFRIKTKDNVVKWFAVSWQPFRNRKGQNAGLRMSMRDIGDRKQMEEALRAHSLKLEELANQRALKIVQLEQRKLHTQKLASLGEVSASIAHEINNPLAGIKNAIWLVRQDTNTTESSIELLRCVDDELNRITKLLQQINQLCRPSTCPPKAIDLKNLIHNVIRGVKAKSPSKSIEVELIDDVEISRFAGWPVIEVCESEVRQILYNVLGNAFEATVQEGTVYVTLSAMTPGMISIEIKDHGCGISPAILPSIFEPFFTTKVDERHPGTGLGLAISRSLAMAIGGTLEVESEPGKFTLFRLAIPVISTNLSPF
jgi:two-component system sporulation sensor kinase C